MLKNNMTNLGFIKCYKTVEEVVKRRDRELALANSINSAKRNPDREPKPDKNCLEKPCKKKVKNVVLFC